MMHFLKSGWQKLIGLAAVLGFVIAPAIATAQTSYQETTLDFVDVTATNVVQTVAETSNNEKDIEHGDIDNDGDMDVVIANALGAFGERRNKLYMNDDGVFNEVSGTAIMPEFSSTSTSRHAFLRDYDGDGWLDIIIVNDSNVGDNNPNDPGRTKFFHNKHPNGVFSHFANETFRLNGATGAACSGASFDFDQNGLADLFMANYPFTSQDTLYFNGINGNPAGEFTDVTSANLPIESDYAVDSSAADMNGDGKIDLLVNSGGFDPNYIHYNDNMGDGSGIGDFQYGGSRQTTSLGSTSWKGTMDPADFDGDGKIDFLYVNKGGFGSTGADVIMMNIGNDTNNKAMFAEYNLSPAVSGRTEKVTITDLDNDGKPDIIVMAKNRRPYIFRNACSPGNVKFIEWTPGFAFPTDSGGGPHRGWHAGAFNADEDNRPDIFVGATNDDYLFKNIPSAVYLEEDLQPSGNLGLAVPVFQNDAPITVIGNAGMDELDIYRASGITAGSTVSVFLRSFSDVELHIKDENAALITVVDDGLAHVAESYEFSAPGGDLVFAVLMKQVSGDGNLDGRVNLLDAGMIRGCFLSNDPACLIFDFDNNGSITLNDSKLFRGQFQLGQASGEYVMELNSRSD